MKKLIYLLICIFSFSSFKAQCQNEDENLYNVLRYTPYVICLKLAPKNFKESLPENEYEKIKISLKNDDKVSEFILIKEHNAIQFIYDNACMITLTFESQKLAVIQYNFNYFNTANNFLMRLVDFKNMRLYEKDRYSNVLGEKALIFKKLEDSYFVEYYF